MLYLYDPLRLDSRTEINDPSAEAKDGSDKSCAFQILDMTTGSVYYDGRAPAGAIYRTRILNKDEILLCYGDTVNHCKITDGNLSTTSIPLLPVNYVQTISANLALYALFAGTRSSTSPQTDKVDIYRPSGLTKIGSVTTSAKSIEDFEVGDNGPLVILDADFRVWYHDISAALGSPPADGIILSPALLIGYKLNLTTSLVRYNASWHNVVLSRDGTWAVFPGLSSRIIIDLKTLSVAEIRSIGISEVKSLALDDFYFHPRGCDALEILRLPAYRGGVFAVTYECQDIDSKLRGSGRESRRKFAELKESFQSLAESG